MHPEILRPQRIEDLDRLLAQTSERPLLLFKHSLTCGTSAEALDELIDHLNEDTLDAHYAIVTVQSHRELSNAVAARLGIRHETPQALLIRDGRVIWSASHFRVTAAAVQSAIRWHAITSNQTKSVADAGR
ncbi:MAG TPA: bacillithiol system redox-active protein YtxJ [Vicinamibacterales bacterium]